MRYLAFDCKRSWLVEIALGLMRCRGTREFRGCGRNQFRFVLQYLPDNHNRRVGLFPLLELDRLADSRDGFDSITGIEARRINLVLEPRPIRQALGGEELAFAFDKELIHFGE